jgi:hypothetical protein
MQLPNRDNAYVPVPKLKGYLLSETHAVGRSKTKFLRAFGFDDSNIELLERGLLSIAQTQEVSDVTSSPHGTKYTIDGSLKTPSGKTIKLRTVWIIDKDHEQPRFVTAIPN